MKRCLLILVLFMVALNTIKSDFEFLPNCGEGYTCNDSGIPVICPKGYFCDGTLATPCPAGFAGLVPGLSQSTCSGKCYEGYFCNEASTSFTQIKCYGGYFGDIKGHITGICSGECEEGKLFLFFLLNLILSYELLFEL